MGHQQRRPRSYKVAAEGGATEGGDGAPWAGAAGTGVGRVLPSCVRPAAIISRDQSGSFLAALRLPARSTQRPLLPGDEQGLVSAGAEPLLRFPAPLG